MFDRLNDRVWPEAEGPLVATSPAILVVEDEPLVRMAAVDVLAQAGYDPLEACDANDAIAVLDEHRPL